MTVVLVETNETLTEVLRELQPFRTYARIDRNGVRWPNGVFYGLVEPVLHDEHEELRKVGFLPYQTGLLIDPWYTLFAEDVQRGVIDFVVYSYDTVIAWHCTTQPGTQEPHWKLADMPVSQSTGTHQIRTVLVLRQLKE